MKKAVPFKGTAFRMYFFELFSVFDNQPLQKRNGGIHNGSEDAKDEYGAHNEVELEHLPTVNDEVADACFRYDIFAHNRSNPCHANVDF